MMKYKEQCGLLLRQQVLFRFRTFFTLLVGIALVLSGIILDMRSAYALNPGDIAIIGVRADDIDATTGNGNDDAFTWVPLVSLAAGAEVFFTDAGWTATNTFRPQEGAIKYTAPAAGLAAGTVMLLELTRDGTGDYLFTPSGGGGTYSNANDAVVGTTGFLTSTAGDQIFIFDGSTTTPNFIWGWKNDGPFDADATNNSTSALPPGLTVGVNAVAVGGGDDTDNNRYVGTASGTVLELVVAIANSANWETTESLPFADSSNDITNGTSGSGFTVGSSNTAPTITSGSTASVTENQTGAIDVQVSDDSDTEGSGLVFSKTGGADQALFNLDTNSGVVTFINAPNFEIPGDAGVDNNYDIQVTVTDSGGLTVVQNIVITVTDVTENTAPIITSGSTASVAENQIGAINIQATDDSDTKGSGLVFSKTGGADQALFNLDTNNGVVTFLNVPNFEIPGDAGADNSYDIQITVTDSGGLTAMQDIVITVTDVVENTAPIITSGNTASVAENQTGAIDIHAADDSDLEGSGLSFSKTGGADQVLFNLDTRNGVVTFISAPDFETPGDTGADNSYDIQITVIDSGGLTAVQNIVITVTDVAENTAPTITGGNTASVAENQTDAIDVQATDDNDSEGSGLTFSKTGGADQALFNLDVSNGVVTFISAPDFETPGDADADNSYDIQVIVTDSGGLTVLQNIVITVTDVVENTAPVLDAIGNQLVNEGQLLAFTVTASDPDNLSYAIGNVPTGATFTDNGDGTAAFSWIPDFGQAGNFPNVLFTVTDDGVPFASDSETIIITVGDVNQPPVLNPTGDRTVAEGDLLEFILTATDPDGDNLSYAIGNAPTGATLVDNGDGTATFSWIPDFGQAGNFPNVLFTVTDDGTPSTSNQETITITVGGVNRPPVLNPIGDRTVAESELLEFTLTAMDPDGDNLSYVIGNAPTGATFVDNGDGTATFSWIPDFGQAGNFPNVLFTVTDDGVPFASDSETITITVGDVNRLPVLSQIGDRTVAEGELLEFTLTAMDPDGDNLGYVIGNMPTGAAFSDNGDGTATFNWMPDFGQAGNFPNVLFTVTDDGTPSASDQETITITVGDVNRLPVLNQTGDHTVTEGELLEFTLTATDPDGDNLSYAIENMPTGAIFTDNGDGTATFSWIPDFGQTGNFPNVQFTVTDDGALSAADSESITIVVGRENSVKIATGGVGAMESWWLLVLAAVWGLLKISSSSRRESWKTLRRNSMRRGFYHKANLSVFSQKGVSK